MAKQVSHPWSKDALLAKSQLFFVEMLRHPRDDWQFAHWSTLALELLARAALANVSPALLADEKNWNNVYYALGFKPKAPKFVPLSIGVVAVFNRLREVLPDFSPDMESFGVVHMSRRNEELHSGDAPFDALSTAKWLPGFYETCGTLAAALGKDLELLLGEEESQLAETMVSGAKDESAKAVLKSVAAHKTVWEAKQPTERKKLADQAAVWATRQEGHRVKCPYTSS